MKELRGSKLPRWKEAGAACKLALLYGYDHGVPESSRPEQLSSLVIDYALALGGQLPDIERFCKPLGAIAPFAMCATDLYNGYLDEAVRIARDPQAPKIAKYHTDEFSTIAVRIARFAIYLAQTNVSLAEVAWVFEYISQGRTWLP